jgi:hypothetical protein
VLHSDEDMIANLDDEERELVTNKVIVIKRFLAMKTTASSRASPLCRPPGSSSLQSATTKR